MTTPVGPLTYLLIPNATDLFAVSQDEIKTNYISLQNLIDVDLIDFSSANAGMHMQSTYVDQATIIPVTAAAGQIVLYGNSTLSPTGSDELWINKTSTIANAIPFTASQQASTNLANGWSYLPSGLLIAWGVGTTNAMNPNILRVDFSSITNFPNGGNFNHVYSAQATAATFTNSGWGVLTLDTEKIVIQVGILVSPAAVPFYWYVIGN